MDPTDTAAISCCHGPSACVFTKALLAHVARCELATRQGIGEMDAVTCRSPVAHTNCGTLLALMRERSAFALRVPRPPTPLMHAQALRLQCGGLQALQHALDVPTAEVHAMVGLAHERHGSLLDLPWKDLVPRIVQWQPRRRRPGPSP